MDKIITIVLLLFITVNIAFSQNVSIPNNTVNVVIPKNINIPNRTVSFYLTSYSGNLTKNTDGSNPLFYGNEFEMGAIYSQNFASAKWLSVWVKTLVITGTTPEYENGKYVGNQKGNYGILEDYGEPQAQVGVNFGGYSLIAMDTRGLAINENYYPLNFGRGGTLTFISILEFFAIPIINTNDSTTEILDLFALRVDYSVNIVDNLSFRTKLSARFYGYLGAGEEKLTTQQFFNNLVVRWENQLIWTIDKFYLWAQLRYEIVNLTTDLEIDHMLGIEAGLGYAFNLSLN